MKIKNIDIFFLGKLWWKRMSNYLKLIRVKHWLKNILVFLPLFFSTKIFQKNGFIMALIAFAIFCISSSIVYIINDMKDVEKDKKHEVKKNRPLASGAISVKNAKKLLVIMIIIDIAMIGISYYFYYKVNNINNIFIILIPLIYILLNILYSIKLKDIQIIDVVILVLGFLLRIIFGGVVTNVQVSKWLYLMVIFGSFYMGFGKRRNEIIKNGSNSRKVLQFYNKDFLDKNMYVAATLAIVSYSLWCVDPLTAVRINTNYLFWTIPIVMVIFQLYSLNIEGNSHGDPIDVIISDKPLLITILLYAIIMILLIYII